MLWPLTVFPALMSNIQLKAFAMEDKIDALRAQIDELNSLVDEPLDDEFEQDRVSDKYLRLGQLILRMQDGDLERRYVLRLEKWLMSDQDAMNYYVEFSEICAGLRMMLGKKMDQLSSVCVV